MRKRLDDRPKRDAEQMVSLAWEWLRGCLLAGFAVGGFGLVAGVCIAQRVGGALVFGSLSVFLFVFLFGMLTDRSHLESEVPEWMVFVLVGFFAIAAGVGAIASWISC